MLQVRVISALEKVFADEPLHAAEKTAFSGFQNECISFQLALCGDADTHTASLSLRAEGQLKEHIRIRSVRSVPVRLATMPAADDNYLRKTPGLYPDLLRDIDPNDPSGDLFGYDGQWQCFWIDCEPQGFPAGEYPVELTVYNKLTGAELARAKTEITVLPGLLPPQTLKRTGWFHSDCLAQYYGVEVFSEEYWRIVENFVSCYVKRGYNMLLTPLFTPPLDTQVGGERLTVQLIDVTVRGGEYFFGFEKLRRWVKMAQRCGIQYFELSHLFTQWGAKHAPKIMAEADGVYKRIFGWETEAAGAEYARFLRCFLLQLMEEITRLGIKENTCFHISDEPRAEMIADYQAARALVAPYVEDCAIMDALSDYAFYASGTVTHPIPAINRLDPFLENKVPELWTYYCVSQFKDVTNLFIAMPSARTRMLGAQLYRYDLAGFLQWGFNFYNSFWSTHPIDPYHTTDADGRFPAGDPLQVYPGRGGRPEESIRLMVLHQAMQDLRALRWLESLIGREKTLQLLKECAEGEITVTRYPSDQAFFERLRKCVNAQILANIQM